MANLTQAWRAIGLIEELLDLNDATDGITGPGKSSNSSCRPD